MSKPMQHTLHFLNLTIICLAIATLHQCKEKPAATIPPKTIQPSYPSHGIRIAWDYSSIKQLADKGGYPRMIRLQDSSLMVIFETYTGDIHTRRSNDNGETWLDPIEVFSSVTLNNDLGSSTRVNMANPEIIQLKNGDIIIGCNYRPAKEEIIPYSVAIRRSTDNGKTWEQARILYSAAPRFKDGCWEPSFLQLPGGELQLYFANEFPYTHSDEQEISMIKSLDNGETWTKNPVTVSFRKNRRDGMPVSILAGDEIIVAIEDNMQGQFKPYTVRTKAANPWTKPVTENSKERAYALADKINDNVYMGAPYLIKLPSGQTVLSYQTTENRSADWERSTMEVAIGDASARKFMNRSRPFKVPQNKEAKWNSLAVWNSTTIVALSSTNFRSANVAPLYIKGYIVPDTIRLGGQKESPSIFVGGEYLNNLRAVLQIENNSLQIICDISGPAKPDNSDGVFIFLDNDQQRYKILTSPSGIVETYKWESSQWKKGENSFSIKTERKEDGYVVCCSVPANFTKKGLRIGFAFKSQNATGSYIEYLSQMDEENPASWLTVVGL